MSSDELLKKIAQLKKKAESSEQLGEAEEAKAFSAKVQQLLLENNLSMADVDMTDSAEEEIVGQFFGFKDVDDELWRKRSRVPWMIYLAKVVAESSFCRILVTDWTAVYFVGTKSNSDVAGYMWVYLTRVLRENCKKDYNNFFYGLRRRGEDVTRARGFMGTYRIGFIQEIESRLSKQMRAQERQASKMALVFVGKMLQRVEQKKQELSGGTVKTGGSVRGGYNSAGGDAGRRLARSIELNRGVGSALNKSRLLGE